MDTRERRYMLGWDQDDMAVAFSWSQSKVARFEADPCSVKLTDEDKIRQEDRARKADAGRDRIMQQMIERKAVQLREKKNLNEWKEELGKREHWMMEAAHGLARKSLRLSGGSLTFNHDREARTLERFLGSDQMVELTVYGTSGRRGRLARRLRDHVPRRRPPYRLRRVG